MAPLLNFWWHGNFFESIRQGNPASLMTSKNGGFLPSER
jgi:hypothetical protein